MIMIVQGHEHLQISMNVMAIDNQSQTMKDQVTPSWTKLS